MSALEALKSEPEIVSVKYYKKTFAPKADSQSESYAYRVLIETPTSCYLLNATEAELEQIKALDTSGADVQPKKVIIIPFYVEIVLGLIILILPFGMKKKAK